MLRKNKKIRNTEKYITKKLLIFVIWKLNMSETLANEVKFTRVSGNLIVKVLLLEDFKHLYRRTNHTEVCNIKCNYSIIYFEYSINFFTKFSKKIEYIKIL